MTPAAGQRGQGGLQLGDRGADGGGLGLSEGDHEVAAGVLDDRGERGLGAQRLDLERLDGVEQRLGAAHRLGGRLECHVRLLALPGLAAPLGDAGAVLGEAEQLLRLGRVRVDLRERVRRVADRQALDGRAGIGEAQSQASGIRSHPRDDLGSATRSLDLRRERLGAVVEQILGPLAELHDARVARPQLFGGVGDLVVVQLVQVERLLQVRAHRLHRLAELGGRTGAEFGVGEGELVGGEPQALVGGDQRLLRAARQIGVLRVQLFLLALASAPESGHGSILRGPLRAS